MSRFMALLICSISINLIALNSAKAAELIEIFVDARDPAYVVVQGVYDNTPQSAWKEMEGYAQLPNVKLVSWVNFRKKALAILAPYVRRDDYPNTQVIQGVLALLLKYPGRPFGVTWNGGIASTFFDYQTAAETWQSYQKDPKAYVKALPRKIADDPLHPANQLPGLLNQQ